MRGEEVEREREREREREMGGIANDVPLFHSSHEETDFMLTCALESVLGLEWRATEKENGKKKSRASTSPSVCWCVRKKDSLRWQK